MKLEPVEHLRNANREWPGLWRVIEEIRSSHAGQWPDYTFLPLERAGESVIKWYAANDPISLKAVQPSNLVGHASVIAGLASWRMGQGVYRFDPALYGALIETPVTGEIPGQLFHHLPEWCVYIETPDMEAPLIYGGTAPLFGVWAWLDYAPDGTDILTLLMNVGGIDRLPVGHVPLVGTLDQALARVEADWKSAIERGNAEGYPTKGYAEAARSTFGPILSLLLYLCSEEPDINGIPQRPKPRKTKHGERIFAADHPKTWQVGERLGAALRQAYLEYETGQHEIDPETGKTRPRAHIRRAHWHTYLTGPKRAKRSLKWLPPIPINMGDLDDLPVTIRPVK